MRSTAGFRNELELIVIPVTPFDGRFIPALRNRPDQMSSLPDRLRKGLIVAIVRIFRFSRGCCSRTREIHRHRLRRRCAAWGLETPYERILESHCHVRVRLSFSRWDNRRKMRRSRITIY